MFKLVFRMNRGFDIILSQGKELSPVSKLEISCFWLRQVKLTNESTFLMG